MPCFAAKTRSQSPNGAEAPKAIGESYQPASPDGRAPRTMGFSGPVKSLVMRDLLPDWRCSARHDWRLFKSIDAESPACAPATETTYGRSSCSEGVPVA